MRLPHVLFLFIILLCITPLFVNASEIFADSVLVPFDYENPQAGTFYLYYEYGDSFDVEKPTIFIIPDGQQFYVRRGTVQKLQKSWFDDRFNVIGIPGRMISETLANKVKKQDNSYDWKLAYSYFKSSQWCSDIDMVRKRVLGTGGKVYLYGGSGGGYLVQEYLARFGEHVSRAFVSGVPNPVVDAQIGVINDTFNDDIKKIGDNYLSKLHTALKYFEKDRGDLIMALSRQHYFYKSEELDSARAALIDSLFNKNRDYFEKIKTEYQVNAINDFMNSPQAIAIRVRMYEFIQTLLEIIDLHGAVIYPTHEMQYNLALPLIQLYEKGEMPAHTMDLNKMSELETEMILLTGKHDKAAGYLSGVELKKNMKNCLLVIADDDHMFKHLRETGNFKKMCIEFFHDGLQSGSLITILEQLEDSDYASVTK